MTDTAKNVRGTPPAATRGQLETRPERSFAARAVSARALIIGGLAVALVSAINPAAAFVLKSWTAGGGSLLGGPVLILFVLVATNGLARRLCPDRALSRGEMLVIYSMLAVSVGFLGAGGLPYLVSVTTYPFYMATPGNEWQHLLWPYIPLWLRVSSPQAVDWFWEGAPPGASAPLGDWLVPALAWCGFTVLLLTAMFCLSSLLSRDWIDRQRLTFPLVEVPLALVGTGAFPSLGSSLLANRSFWVGAGLPAAAGLLNWLHRFLPNVPAVALWGLPVGKAFVGAGLPWSVLSDTVISVSWATLGVMCLIPTEISLSLWLFYLLYKVQLLAWASLGAAPGAPNAGLDPVTLVGFQEFGGAVMLAGLLLWESRRAFRSAWLGLTQGREEEHDPDAALSPRTALIGFAVANVLMFCFMGQGGVPWIHFASLLGLFYVIMLIATRVIASGGVMVFETSVLERDVLMAVVGARTFGATSLVMFAYFTGIYTNDPMNLAMPQMLSNLKLMRSSGTTARRLAWAALAAVVVMLVVGLPALLRTIYAHGGGCELPHWPFNDIGNWVFGQVDASLRSPEAPNGALRLGMLVGALEMAALCWLHARVAWWPVSPIGFVMASSWAAEWGYWTCALLGWLIASQVKRYGGLRLYRSLRPVFLGLIIGEFLSDGLFGIVNSLMDLRKLAL